MRSVTLLGLSAVVAVVAAGALVAGDRLHGRADVDTHHESMIRVLERIGVSADQRRELEAVHRRHDEVAEGMEGPMVEAHERLVRTIHLDVFDETAIRTAAAVYAALQADLFVAKAETLQEARRILTPDQWEQLRDAHMQGAAHGSLGHHRDHKGHGGSPGGGHGGLHGHGTNGNP